MERLSLLSGWVGGELPQIFRVVTRAAARSPSLLSVRKDGYKGGGREKGGGVSRQPMYMCV